MIRQSTSYRFTADIMSASDMIQIGELRKNISALNKISKKKYRVVLRGRKPFFKKSVNVYPYGTGMRKNALRSYDYFGNIVDGLRNASHVDVYVYERY